MLYRALYISHAKGNMGDDLRSVADIIGVSDRNNRREGLTGLLLYHGGRFLQVLEGPQGGIERLLQTLSRDTRHDRLTLLSLAPASQRAFAAWSMAQAYITPSVAPLLAGRDLGDLGATDAEALLRAAGVQMDA